jgi:peptide/nickel transport system substrate-binding protein
MEAGGKAGAHRPGGDIEFIRSTSPTRGPGRGARQRQSKHFAFSDPKVREAMALLCDKKSMEVHLRPHGFATGNS